MGKHTNGASSQQNTYHLPKAPTATSNLIYLPTSIPHFPFLYIPPKLTDDISTPIIPAHLLYPQNSAIRVKCISSSKFPPKNTYTPSLPCPTHHPPNLTTLPPTNQKKAIKFSLALTRPYHKTSRSHSQPPPKKRNHQHHQHTPHPNTTPHHRILKNKSQPPPLCYTHKPSTRNFNRSYNFVTETIYEILICGPKNRFDTGKGLGREEEEVRAGI